MKHTIYLFSDIISTGERIYHKDLSSKSGYIITEYTKPFVDKLEDLDRHSEVKFTSKIRKYEYSEDWEDE